jgi:hypothetical protein
MFFSHSREQEVETLIQEHFVTVQETLQEFHKMFDDYLEHNKLFKEEAYRIHELEHNADVIRHTIEAKLYEGAFLPIYREDYVELVEEVDKVANQAESSSDFIVLTRPQIPDFMIPGLLEIVDATCEMYTPFLNVLTTFNTDMSKVYAATTMVKDLEQQVDKMEWDLIKSVFKSDLDLARKLHLKQLVETISQISNIIEDAADRFEIMVLKRKM